MPEPWMPDGASSRALLIGVPNYESPELPQIPAVRNNLHALKEALSGQQGLLLPNHCRTLGSDSDSATVDQGGIGRELSSARREAKDLLLVYYAGHGLLDDDGLLHLAVTHTEPQNIGFTSLPFQLLKRELAQSRAKARVLVLDCCFSGRAVTAMSTPRDLLSGQLDLNGTYTLTSTTATTPSHAPPGAPYTTFTEALLSTLTQPEALTLDDIYREIDRKLTSSGLPPPQARSVNSASHLILTRGPVKTQTPPSPPTPQHRPGPPEVRFSAKVNWRVRFPPSLIFIMLILSAIITPTCFLSGSSSPVAPLIGVVTLLPFYWALARTSYGRFTSVVIDDTGLTLKRPGRHPFQISWEHISYFGMLHKYAYYVKREGNQEAENILLLRPWQDPGPSLKGTFLFSSSYGNQVPRSLRTIGYVGFPIQDVSTDPMRLLQAVGRLSGLPYRSDQELCDLDPRLSSRVGSTQVWGLTIGNE